MVKATKCKKCLELWWSTLLNKTFESLDAHWSLLLPPIRMECIDNETICTKSIQDRLSFEHEVEKRLQLSVYVCNVEFVESDQIRSIFVGIRGNPWRRIPIGYHQTWERVGMIPTGIVWLRSDGKDGFRLCSSLIDFLSEKGTNASRNWFHCSIPLFFFNLKKKE